MVEFDEILYFNQFSITVIVRYRSLASRWCGCLSDFLLSYRIKRTLNRQIDTSFALLKETKTDKHCSFVMENAQSLNLWKCVKCQIHSFSPLKAILVSTEAFSPWNFSVRHEMASTNKSYFTGITASNISITSFFSMISFVSVCSDFQPIYKKYSKFSIHFMIKINIKNWHKCLKLTENWY